MIRAVITACEQTEQFVSIFMLLPALHYIKNGDLLKNSVSVDLYMQHCHC